MRFVNLLTGILAQFSRLKLENVRKCTKLHVSFDSYETHVQVTRLTSECASPVYGCFAPEKLSGRGETWLLAKALVP